MLDATRAEIMPQLRLAPVDEPDASADHLVMRSELGQNLQAMFDAALAHAGALNSDDDLPAYSALAEAANLTLAEYEAVAMNVDGWPWEEIAKFQHVKPEASRSSFRRGVHKIRQYVLNSTSTGFSSSVLRGFEGGDEA